MISAIWKIHWPDPAAWVEEVLDQAARRSTGPCRVYFRADDVGRPSEAYTEMIRVFHEHETPLNLAVVPDWLTEKNWEAIQKPGGGRDDLWVWHQHGFAHRNHQTTGKKSEFGDQRPKADKERDLAAGRDRLRKLLGGRFYPVFTPPWNRCDRETLELLLRFEYYAVSTRSGRGRPPEIIPEINVHIDLHTRKAPEAEADAVRLRREMIESLSRDRCGFMLHHERMNEAARRFVNALLPLLKRDRRMEVVSFTEPALWRA
jgi:hypothetical protein